LYSLISYALLSNWTPPNPTTDYLDVPIDHLSNSQNNQTFKLK